MASEYRDFWEDIIQIVADVVNSDIYTQEQIDDTIAENFQIFSGYTDNQDFIPDEFKMRTREFYDPVDLMRWLSDGGVPTSSTFVWREITDGDYIYHVFISATS